MSEAVVFSTADIAGRNAVRREFILDAAQDVFTAKGFEVATMQDVAQACDMSAGNLYRYFASKAAIVSGLVERDSARMAASFAELAANPNQLESFEQLARDHLKNKCGLHSKLTLEIWAASSRRPELHDLCLAMEKTVRFNLDVFLRRLAAEGKLAEGADPAMISHLMMALSQSLFRDAALKPDHDTDGDIDILLATIRAAMAGHIQVHSTDSNTVEAVK